MTGCKPGSHPRVLRWPRIPLLIVLTTIVIVAELPQGGGWVLRPTVLTLTFPGIFLIRSASRPERFGSLLDAFLDAARERGAEAGDSAPEIGADR